jgi:VanZ family protein
LTLAIAAFGLSLLPESAKRMLHTNGPIHPWLHLGLFTTLGVLAMLSSRSSRVRLPLLLSAALLGLAIEYSEAMRFHAAVEVNDVVVDACGVLLGGVLGWLLARRA